MIYKGAQAARFNRNKLKEMHTKVTFALIATANAALINFGSSFGRPGKIDMGNYNNAEFYRLMNEAEEAHR